MKQVQKQMEYNDSWDQELLALLQVGRYNERLLKFYSLALLIYICSQPRGALRLSLNVTCLFATKFLFDCCRFVDACNNI